MECNIGRVSLLIIIAILDIWKKIPIENILIGKILNLNLRQKVTIEFLTKIDTKNNQNTKIDTNNYQIIDKSDLVYLTFMHSLKINSPNPLKDCLNWIGINE